MTQRVVAHFTDTHLGQKLVMGADMAGEKMRYDRAPGENEARLRRVLDDIARKKISEVIFGGDIGDENAVAEFFQALRGYGFGVSIVLGNHDRLRAVSQYWPAGFEAIGGKMCSSKDDGGMKSIVLDSSDNMIGDRQLAWLARELEGTGKAALFLHHPILAIDTPLERAGAALKDRSAILALLTSTHCEVSVFCGHYHMIDEANEANIRQYVTPAVSYQIVKDSDRIRADARTYGYRLIQIGDAGIKTEVVLLTGPR